MCQCRFLLNNLGQGLHLSAESCNPGVRKKDAFRLKDDLPILLKRLTLKILVITQALRSLTAEVAIKCLILRKGV
jgi:hypothetical protein